MESKPPIVSGSDPAPPDNTEPFQALMMPVFRVQLVREKGVERVQIEGPDDVAQIISHYLEHEDREHFVTVMLDAKCRVIGIHTVHIGTLTCSLVSAREVFKAAILANAASVILAHNHPSGDLTPSPEDLQVTDILRNAGKILDIEVLDHVIVGENGSFRSLNRSSAMPK
ncbi:MAG: JAB domain-containing protein [Fimbriimonadaceae bacterium]|nr:JAB domain-containing protein [Fimbriimonadaceae bacterium]